MRPFVLLGLGAVAGAMLGVWVAAVGGPLLGAIAGVGPPAGVGLLLEWQNRRHAAAMQAEIDRLQDRLDHPPGRDIERRMREQAIREHAAQTDFSGRGSSSRF